MPFAAIKPSTAFITRSQPWCLSPRVSLTTRTGMARALMGVESLHAQS